MLKQQSEVVSGLRCCGGRRGQWSLSFRLSVSADSRPPPPPPHGLRYTFSISLPPFFTLFSPSSYLSKPLCGASPASPHHLTLSLQYLPLPSMSPTLHPPPTTTTMLFQCCCLSLSNNCTPDRAQWVLLQTHPGRHTPIHAHAQAHIHTHTNTSTLLHAQGLVPHRGLLLVALWEMDGDRRDIVHSNQNNAHLSKLKKDKFLCLICYRHAGMLYCCLSYEHTDGSPENLSGFNRSSLRTSVHHRLFSQRQYDAPLSKPLGHS